MPNIKQRLERLQPRETAALIVYAADGTKPASHTPEQVAAWQQQHPSGTVICIEYGEPETNFSKIQSKV